MKGHPAPFLADYFERYASKLLTQDRVPIMHSMMGTHKIMYPIREAKVGISSGYFAGFNVAAMGRLGKKTQVIKTESEEKEGAGFFEEEYKRGFAAGSVTPIKGTSYLDANGEWYNASSGWPWGISDKNN